MTAPAAENLRQLATVGAFTNWHTSWVLSAHAAADLLDAIDAQVAELLAEHQPMWVSDEAKAAGKEPWVCLICGTADGSWPCISRLIADDMHRLLHPEEDGHTIDVGYVHTQTFVDGERRCTVNCPHPDHHPEEEA